MAVFVFTRLSLKDIVVHSVLFSEAHRTLLSILRTGVDSVEICLASQGRYAFTLGTWFIPATSNFLQRVI